MNNVSKKNQIVLTVGLFLVCVCFYFVFMLVNKYCFDDRNNNHTIDIHVQKCGVNGLWDGPYVEKVAPLYDKSKYKKSFLLVDTIYPIAYSAFLLSLNWAYRRRKWFYAILSLITAGAAFDYSENFTFLYYLYYPSSSQADLVAFCTSLKSLLLVSNIIIGLFFFIRGMFAKNIP